MLQIIGLIMAVYAVCRLGQVGFEMGNGSGEVWNGLPWLVRFVIVRSISLLDIIVLLFADGATALERAAAFLKNTFKAIAAKLGALSPADRTKLAAMLGAVAILAGS